MGAELPLVNELDDVDDDDVLLSLLVVLMLHIIDDDEVEISVDIDEIDTNE